MQAVFSLHPSLPEMCNSFRATISYSVFILQVVPKLIFKHHYVLGLQYLFGLKNHTNRIFAFSYHTHHVTFEDRIIQLSISRP